MSIYMYIQPRLFGRSIKCYNILQVVGSEKPLTIIIPYQLEKCDASTTFYLLPGILNQIVDLESQKTDESFAFWENRCENA